MRRTFIQARPSIPRDSMIPGGRVNPRQMRQAMKRLGIEQEELAGVEEVVIRTATKEYVIRDPNVTAMTAQGQKIWTVVGEPIVPGPRIGSAGECFGGGLLILTPYGRYKKAREARVPPAPPVSPPPASTPAPHDERHHDSDDNQDGD